MWVNSINWKNTDNYLIHISNDQVVTWVDDIRILPTCILTIRITKHFSTPLPLFEGINQSFDSGTKFNSNWYTPITSPASLNDVCFNNFSGFFKRDAIFTWRQWPEQGSKLFRWRIYTVGQSKSKINRIATFGGMYKKSARFVRDWSTPIFYRKHSWMRYINVIRLMQTLVWNVRCVSTLKGTRSSFSKFTRFTNLSTLHVP